MRRMKLDIQMPKRPARRRAPASDSPVTNDLAARLAELHREYGSIGPLLFGIKHHQEIADCPNTPATLAKLAFGSDGYPIDISEGMRLAAHVLVRGDAK